MMELLKLVEHLEWLESRATPIDFSAYERGQGIFREFEIRHNGGALFRSTSYGHMEQDALLLTAARNAIPQLCQAVREMSEALNGCADISVDFMPTDYPYRRQIMRAREVLAKYGIDAVIPPKSSQHGDKCDCVECIGC